MPSASDTVKVAISLGITVDSIDDASEATVVPAVVAVLDGIAEEDVKDYAVSTDTFRQRRQLIGTRIAVSDSSPSQGRQLSLGATATLDIQVSLSAAGNKDANSLLDRINSELEASVRVPF